MKKVYILHISKFGGHSKAAHNLKEAFLNRNSQAKVSSLNILGYFYPRSEKVIDFIYMLTIKYWPSLWGRAYDRKKVVKAISPYLKFINRITFRRLSGFVKKYKPDCFVATQAFPCRLIADFKERFGLIIPLVAIVTDYHPHRFWIHPFVDKYVVACQEAKEALIHEGVEEEKIKILGIPISVNFLTAYSKEQVSKELSFSKDLDSVLIMGGGLGIGPIKAVAKALDVLNDNFQIIVVCGANKNLYDWFIRNKIKFRKPIFVFSYTSSIHKIMDFSDIIITKGGGITVSEALAKNLSIIVVNPIPGQEERNVSYLLKKQAVIKAEEVNEVGWIISNLLKDKEKMFFLKERTKDISFIDSSPKIVDLILELIN
ncbi:MAG: glycosyltransferase [Candidatus Omnitrophota bacterium]